MTQENFELLEKAIELVKENKQSLKWLEEVVIVNILSENSEVLSILIKILHQERESKDLVIRELNHELSRADIYLRDPKYLKANKEFALNNIKQFFLKYWGKFGVGHCYKQKENL